MKMVVSNENSVLGNLEMLVEKALNDVCTTFTPVKPSNKEMKDLILKVYYGN